METFPEHRGRAPHGNRMLPSAEDRAGQRALKWLIEHVTDKIRSDRRKSHFLLEVYGEAIQIRLLGQPHLLAVRGETLECSRGFCHRLLELDPCRRRLPAKAVMMADNVTA